jgi:hypothetical protein
MEVSSRELGFWTDVKQVLQASQYSDISVNQWLGLTPKQVLKDHLHLDDDVLDSFPKTKPIVVQGNPDLTTTDFAPGEHGGA